MFRPSQSLLFRPMPALNKLKIHHPLPLNPRESKQLLNILTSSFRQHLDTEHPQLRSDNASQPSQHSFPLPRRRRSSSDFAAHPADRHMHSLLTNPLFNSPSTNSESSIRDPMSVFDQAVAKGIMNTRYAHACLKKIKSGIVKSSVLNIRDGMKDSRAGLRVLKWLISSGTANDNEFLKNEAFAGILMEFIVAEGLQEAAWTWIKRALEARSNTPKTGPARSQAVRDTVTPLMCLIKAEIMGAVPLDAGYLCLSRAAGYLKGSSLQQMRPFLGPPCWLLAQRTIHHLHPPPSESSFESFLSLVPVFTEHIDYYFAHLNVLHPTKPNAESALAYLRKLDTDSNTESFQEPKDVRERRKHVAHINLGLDTAKFLLETHRFSEAEWVMDFLRTNYPKQLGVEHKKQLEQSRAEASSLELLEGLSLV